MSSSSRFFRMEQRKIAIGNRLQGSGVDPLAHSFPKLVEILDRNRPPNCLLRGACVYMRDDRDFSAVGLDYGEGYVHEVKPFGRLERRDVNWIGVLQSRYLTTHSNQHKVFEAIARRTQCSLSDDEVADRYWSGCASDRPTWEYVASEAEIVAVDEMPSRISKVAQMNGVIEALLKPRADAKDE